MIYISPKENIDRIDLFCYTEYNKSCVGKIDW